MRQSNDLFATDFGDGDRVVRRLRDDIAPKVRQDRAYRNARANAPATADMELNAALKRIVTPLFKDDTEFHKQFIENPASKRFARDAVLALNAADGAAE